jgi:hypothetical protein
MYEYSFTVGIDNINGDERKRRFRNKTRLQKKK